MIKNGQQRIQLIKEIFSMILNSASFNICFIKYDCKQSGNLAQYAWYNVQLSFCRRTGVHIFKNYKIIPDCIEK